MMMMHQQSQVEMHRYRSVANSRHLTLTQKLTLILLSYLKLFIWAPTVIQALLLT